MLTVGLWEIGKRGLQMIANECSNKRDRFALIVVEVEWYKELRLAVADVVGKRRRMRSKERLAPYTRIISVVDTN
jgi:hypothetical protein